MEQNIPLALLKVIFFTCKSASFLCFSLLIGWYKSDPSNSILQNTQVTLVIFLDKWYLVKKETKYKEKVQFEPYKIETINLWYSRSIDWIILKSPSTDNPDLYERFSSLETISVATWTVWLPCAYHIFIQESSLDIESNNGHLGQTRPGLCP